MIFRVGDGPWMLRVQTPTYSYNMVISEDVVNTIRGMTDPTPDDGHTLDDPPDPEDQDESDVESDDEKDENE